MIPRDVRTRWNSTYDMIKMAIEYSKAIKRICSDADNGLRDFELSTEEWKIAEQLRDALEVRFSASPSPFDRCGNEDDHDTHERL